MHDGVTSEAHLMIGDLNEIEEELADRLVSSTLSIDVGLFSLLCPRPTVSRELKDVFWMKFLLNAWVVRLSMRSHVQRTSRSFEIS